MSEQEIIHHDRIGQKIELEDIVAVANNNALWLAKVTRLTKKMIRIERFPRPSSNGALYKYPRDSVKLDKEYLAFFIIKGGK